jgi:hypothetical protein
MSTRDLLRTCIVKTNPYWPFSWCNRLPYALATRVLVQAFRDRPEIRSMWIWHDHWTPAMSDIDLLVLIRGGLTADQEYEFLEYFWKTFDRLRRVFPMLEAKILSEDELPVWLSYANSGHPDLTPVCLHVVDDGALAAVESPRWRQFAVSFALWVYMDVLPPCFAAPDSFLRRQDVQRRVRKILRLLKPLLSEAGHSCGSVEANSVADAILAIERAVVYLESIALPDDREPGWLPGYADGREYSPAGLPALDGVRSVIRSRSGKVLIVTEDGLGREGLDRVIEAGHRQWAAAADAPVVLPRRVFAYLIRVNNPYSYSGLLAKRIIVVGADPLAGIAPPGRGAFAAYTLSRIAHTLAFTRSDTVFSRSEPLSLADCETSLERANAVRLLLRDDWISPHRPEVRARWRSEFPECAVAFDQIKLHLAEGRDQTARQAFFHLFRPIARDILDRIGSARCGLVATRGPAGNLSSVSADRE